MVKNLRERWTLVALASALAIVTMLVYLPVRGYELLNWDDLSFLPNNDHVKGGLTWNGIVWSFTHSYSANWCPLTWISYMAGCQFYGLSSAGHHLTNAALHAINTALLFLLLRRFTSTTWRSAFVAALFGLHPVHVESVAWIAERKDVLSTLFFLLTLLAYARYVASKVQSQDAAPGRGSALEISDPGPRIEFATPNTRHASGFKFLLLSLLLFTLGLLSKPMLVTLPFVLLLLDFWPLRRFEPSTNNHELSTLLWEKLPFFALSAACCVITIISQKEAGAVASFEAIPFAARLENAAVAYVEYVAKFFWPANLSPLYPHMHWAAWQIAGSLALLLIVTALAWSGRSRFPYLITGWLWFLGTLIPVIGIVQVGSQAFADRYTYIPLIGIMLATTWLVMDVTARWNLKLPGKLVLGVSSCLIFALLTWRTSQQLRYWKNTQTLFTRVLELAPNSVQALYALGSNLIDTGKIEEGKKLVERAIALQPSYAEALGTLANTFDTEGKYEEAVRYYNAALKSAPDNPSVLNNLAWLRASCRDPTFRDGAEAVRLASRACELTGYGKPLFIGTLAAAQAEAGDFQSAIATAERAASLATSLRLEDIAGSNRELITLYRQGKAAHGGAPKTK